MSKVDSHNTHTYKAKRFSATKHKATVILEDDGFENILYIHDGKLLERLKLSSFALDAIEAVLELRDSEAGDEKTK